MHQSLTGLFLLVLSGAGCAHAPADRAPAEAPTKVKAGYKVEMNVKGEPGTFALDATAIFPPNPEVAFSEIVDLFRDVVVSSEVNAILTTYKDPPLDKIAYDVKKIEAKDRVTYDIFGYPKGFRIAGSTSRIACPETYTRDTGKGYWRQACAADFTYKSTGDYMKAYTHSIECRERGKSVECSYHVDATVKPVKVPFIARLLFKARNYSATQAGYKMAENLLHSFYGLAKVADQPKPFLASARKAVEAYRNSDDYRQVTKLDRAYPEDIKATTGGKFTND